MFLSYGRNDDVGPIFVCGVVSGSLGLGLIAYRSFYTSPFTDDPATHIPPDKRAKQQAAAANATAYGDLDDDPYELKQDGLMDGAAAAAAYDDDSDPFDLKKDGLLGAPPRPEDEGGLELRTLDPGVEEAKGAAVEAA